MGVRGSVNAAGGVRTAAGTGIETGDAIAVSRATIGSRKTADAPASAITTSRCGLTTALDRPAESARRRVHAQTQPAK